MKSSPTVITWKGLRMGSSSIRYRVSWLRTRSMRDLYVICFINQSHSNQRAIWAGIWRRSSDAYVEKFSIYKEITIPPLVVYAAGLSEEDMHKPQVCVLILGIRHYIQCKTQDWNLSDLVGGWVTVLGPVVLRNNVSDQVTHAIHISYGFRISELQYV